MSACSRALLSLHMGLWKSVLLISPKSGLELFFALTLVEPSPAINPPRKVLHLAEVLGGQQWRKLVLLPVHCCMNPACSSSYAAHRDSTKVILLHFASISVFGAVAVAVYLGSSTQCKTYWTVCMAPDCLTTFRHAERERVVMTLISCCRCAQVLC